MRTLKAFTSYVCPVGHGRLGHSSHYTGAYQEQHRRDSDGICICGASMVEEVLTKNGKRYRLEFETINPHQAAAIAAARGKDVWPSLTAEEWGGLEWMPPTVRESEVPGAITAQYETLLSWAEQRTQPIRNVRLLTAPASAAPEWKEKPPLV